MLIEIISLPKGEAPEHIRAAWIGLHLTASDNSPIDMPISHVISGPRSRIGVLIHRLRGLEEHWDGFVVNALDAVETLAALSPHAAIWWQDNTPHLLDGKQSLVFDAECCRVVQRFDAANLNAGP